MTNHPKRGVTDLSKIDTGIRQLFGASHRGLLH